MRLVVLAVDTGVRKRTATQRDSDFLTHTRKSIMTFAVAATTRMQRPTFDIVSIVPSIKRAPDYAP